MRIAFLQHPIQEYSKCYIKYILKNYITIKTVIKVLY